MDASSSSGSRRKSIRAAHINRRSSSRSSSSGGGPPGGSSSSRPDSSGGSSHIAQTQQKRFTMDAYDAFKQVLNYICALGDVAVVHIQLIQKELSVWHPVLNLSEAAAAVAVTIGSAATTAAADVAAAWSGHAVQLCSTVECYVRLQAARPSGGSLAQLDTGLVLLCSRFISANHKWQNGGLLQASLAAGPGSDQQAQVIGLLSSLLKVARQLPPVSAGWLTDVLLSAALASATILQDAGVQEQRTHLQQRTQEQDAEQLCIPAANGSPQMSNAPAAPQSDTAADPAAALPGIVSSVEQYTPQHLLPWVVLFGRCCSIWAEQLLRCDVGQHPEGPISAFMGQLPYRSIAEMFTLPLKEGPLDQEVTDPHTAAAQTVSLSQASTASQVNTLPVSCVIACRAWLSEPSTAAHLAADDYQVDVLLAKLDAAMGAAGVVQQQMAAGAASGPGISAEAVMQLVQALRALGQALSTLAISSACNNPTCSNISGPSEAGLVESSSSTCAGCRVARYCCRACQHWKLHKPVCKALAAARAGGGQ